MTGRLLSPRVQDRIDRGCLDHTLRLLAPWTGPGDRVLDLGCGSAALGWALEAERGFRHVVNADVAELRERPVTRYLRCDSTALPFADRTFDLVVITSVLHHVPNAGKAGILREAARVARGRLFILEDTPSGPVDAMLCQCHGWSWRIRNRSRAHFGFYSHRRWLELFERELGLRVEAAAQMGRWERPALPHRRSWFLLARDGPASPPPQVNA